MSSNGSTPGPIADRTFDVGFNAAAVGGFAALTSCYVLGFLSLSTVVFTLVFLYPTYLVFVALLLATWLGYDTDRSNLERVVVEADDESRVSRDRWPL